MRTLFVMFIFFIPFLAAAKNNYPLEDCQVWSSVQFEFKIDSKLELEISEELRFNNNAKVLNQSLTDLGAAYSVSDIFKTGLFYRFRTLPVDNESQNEAYCNLIFSFRLLGFKQTNRIRIHEKYRSEKKPVHLLRYQFGLAYPVLQDIILFSSAELFYRYLYNEGDRLTQGRFKTGISFETIKWLELELYYMREQEYNNSESVNSNIFGIDIKYSF